MGKKLYVGNLAVEVTAALEDRFLRAASGASVATEGTRRGASAHLPPRHTGAT